MYITELHSLAPLPPKIRYFFPVNYGWEALKVVFRVASKACQKMHRLFWPIRCLVEHTTNGAIMPKKNFRHNGIFFCLLLYMSARSGFWNIPLMHINLFSRTIFMIFLMSFPSLFCRYDQYLEKKLEHWKRILECPAAIPERQMFEYSQLRSLLTLTAERLFGDY